MSQEISPAMRECIDNCVECYRVCLETIEASLTKGGEHMGANHLRLLQNCAAICQTSAQFMITGSEFHSEICGVCADVCQACAESCEQFEKDDEMELCADVCRECAESCDTMSAGTEDAA